MPKDSDELGSPCIHMQEMHMKPAESPGNETSKLRIVIIFGLTEHAFYEGIPSSSTLSWLNRLQVEWRRQFVMEELYCKTADHLAKK